MSSLSLFRRWQGRSSPRRHRRDVPARCSESNDLKSARWGRDPADVVSPLAWIRHTACMQLGGMGIWKKVTGCLTMWQASVICT